MAEINRGDPNYVQVLGWSSKNGAWLDWIMVLISHPRWWFCQNFKPRLRKKQTQSRHQDMLDDEEKSYLTTTYSIHIGIILDPPFEKRRRFLRKYWRYESSMYCYLASFCHAICVWCSLIFQKNNDLQSNCLSFFFVWSAWRGILLYFMQPLKAIQR